MKENNIIGKPTLLEIDKSPIFPITDSSCVIRPDGSTLESIIESLVKISQIEDGNILELYPDIDETLSLIEVELENPESLLLKLDTLENKLNDHLLNIELMNKKINVIENRIKEGVI